MNGNRVHEARLVVEHDHPSFDGHFPGNPLLPGVVVLDRVLSATEEWLGAGWRAAGLPQVKFVAPLRPGDAATIRLEQRDGRVHFEVLRGDVTIARGILSPPAAPAPG